jgi:hypothetical protein
MSNSLSEGRSWIITSKETGLAVFETFEKKTADAVNRAKYNVETAHDYLCRLNAQILSRGAAA